MQDTRADNGEVRRKRRSRARYRGERGTKMARYFFPCLFLVPDPDTMDIQVGEYGLVIRKWDVSIFDLATLQVKHKLHLPYELINVFLKWCNLEFTVEAASVEEAMSKVQFLRTMLYIQGIAPFIIPIVASHSINDIAGINSRDSDLLRQKLPEGLREGLTSDMATVEVWPFELSLHVISIGEHRITSSLFESACNMARRWESLLQHHPPLRAVQDALTGAPTLGSISQSILHIWAGLESLFPSVNTEVSFRLALYLTQLNVTDTDKRMYFSTIQKAYRTRSKIAHGSIEEASTDDWKTTWELLCDACRSVLQRGNLPSEDDLLRELLGPAKA